MDVEAIDAAHVHAAVAGDDAALEQLLRAIEPTLRAAVTIQPLWRRSLDVDDLLQVTYLEAFLRIESLRDRSPGGFVAWMQRALASNVVDAIRGLERDKRPDARRRLTHDGSGASARTLFERVSGLEPSASAAMSLAEQSERLRATIARLPASYRQVVEEVDLAERSVADVAAEMGRSPGAVHLLVRRAHDRLRELMS